MHVEMLPLHKTESLGRKSIHFVSLLCVCLFVTQSFFSLFVALLVWSQID